MTVDQALSAYARGCTQNRLDVKLQETFVKKILTLGRPDHAYHAANQLTEIAPRNALGWGVLGYLSAKKGQLQLAMRPAVKAATLDNTNAPICHNAAQLVAWYESGSRQALDGETRSLMGSLKSSGASIPAFSKSYNSAKAGFDRLKKDLDAKQKEADATKAEAKKIEQTLTKLTGDLRSKGSTYESARQKADNADRSIDRAEESMRRSSNYNSRRSYERQRDSAVRQLRDAKRDMGQALSEGKKIRNQRDGVQKQYDVKQAQVNRLLREVKAMRDGVPKSFGWLPPAVDGKVTADSTVAAAKPNPGTSKGQPKPGTSYLLPDQPKPIEPAKPATLSEQLAEAEAADKLSLAKIYMEGEEAGMKAAAKQRLQEILATYPNTKAASEARELIKKLP